MTITVETIELGRLCGDDAAPTGLRHQLLYLPDRQMVVMPYCRTQRGWTCAVVGSREPRPLHHPTLTEDALGEALRRIPVDPYRDPDGYARLAWMSQAFRRWPGGAMPAFTDHIVNRLRPPASRHVPAPVLGDHDAIARWLPNTRPPAVGRLIDRLVAAGMLTRTADDVWSLTLTEPHRGG